MSAAGGIEPHVLQIIFQSLVAELSVSALRFILFNNKNFMQFKRFYVKFENQSFATHTQPYANNVACST